MVRKNTKIHIALGLIIILIAVTMCSGCGISNTKYMINVSYDASRELYEKYNKLFEKHWKEKTGKNMEIIQSHGGSGKQALEVANGL